MKINARLYPAIIVTTFVLFLLLALLLGFRPGHGGGGGHEVEHVAVELASALLSVWGRL